MYGKIFDSMYEGTLYGHWEAIVTLQQMLVLCNSEGVIDMTPQAIAARTSIPLDIITKGIGILSEADPYSRTPGEDGKRISLLDSHRPWGWMIVNYRKYRDLKSRNEKLEADRFRIAEKRKASKNIGVADSRNASQPVADVAYAATATTTDIKQSAQKRATRLSADWKLPKAWGDWALKERSTWNEDHVRKVSAQFKNYWIAKGGRDAAKVDWYATWQNWVWKDPELKQGTGSVQQPMKCSSCGSTNFSSLTNTSRGRLCNICIDK